MTSLKQCKDMEKYFIGIDFAKEKFDVVVLQEGRLSDKGDHAQFPNNANGVCMLEKWLRRTCGKDVASRSVVCGENTGVYSVTASKRLVMDGYTVCLESALRIKRSLGLTRGKNDKQDARSIAEYAARHRDRLTPYRIPSEARRR